MDPRRKFCIFVAGSDQGATKVEEGHCCLCTHTFHLTSYLFGFLELMPISPFLITFTITQRGQMNICCKTSLLPPPPKTDWILLHSRTSALESSSIWFLPLQLDHDTISLSKADTPTIKCPNCISRHSYNVLSLSPTPSI